MCFRAANVRLALYFTSLGFLAFPQNNRAQVAHWKRNGKVHCIKDLCNKNVPNWKAEYKVEGTGSLLRDNLAYRHIKAQRATDLLQFGC